MNGTENKGVGVEEDNDSANTPHDFSEQFLLLLKRHTECACVEFIPGKDDVVTIMAGGNTIQTNEHKDDRIEVYCNTVQHMRDFLSAEMYYYKKMPLDTINVIEYIKQWESEKPIWNDKYDLWDFKIKMLEYYRELYRRLLMFAHINYYFKKLL